MYIASGGVEKCVLANLHHVDTHSIGRLQRQTSMHISVKMSSAAVVIKSFVLGLNFCTIFLAFYFLEFSFKIYAVKRPKKQ